VSIRQHWDLDDAELPAVAVHMLNARVLNQWCGTSYRLEEVAKMPALLFEILQSLQQGLEPPAKGK